MHYEQPRIEGADDTLGEDRGVALLTTLFDVEPIYEYQDYSLTLDFYDNWNEYCGGRERLEAHRF
jgi:hypothetical protein